MTSIFVPEPVISLAIKPVDKNALDRMAKALNRFTKEDPTFRTHVDPESHETIIQGMGELHLDVYVERMKREYDAEVETGKPQVAYREAITDKSRVRLHPQEADRRRGPVRPGHRAHRAESPRASTSSSTTSRAAASRASSSPPATRDSRRP